LTKLVEAMRSVGVILKTPAPDARHVRTRSLCARFRHSSIRQHTRFSTGQIHASENGRLGEKSKAETLALGVKGAGGEVPALESPKPRQCRAFGLSSFMV
jgi:hypothetical protein